MKILLAIMVSTMFTASAFAACDPAKANECKIKEECEAMSTEGRKFSFDASEKDVKCRVQDKVVATKCTEGNDSMLTADKSSAGKDAKTPGAGAQAK